MDGFTICMNHKEDFSITQLLNYASSLGNALHLARETSTSRGKTVKGEQDDNE